MGFAALSSALQRNRGETRVATVASPQASCEGEMAYQSAIVGKLERGSIAVVSRKGPDGDVNQCPESIHMNYRCIFVSYLTFQEYSS